MNDSVSEFLPPVIREALVRAAVAGDVDAVDRLTDLASDQYPELVRPRTEVRDGYESTAVARARAVYAQRAWL